MESSFIISEIESFVVNTDGSLTQIEENKDSKLPELPEQRLSSVIEDVTQLFDHNYSILDCSLSNVDLPENPSVV